MIKALSGRIIAEIPPIETRLDSGLYLPDNKKDIPLRVRVISCGSDYLRRDNIVIKAPCKDGDIIHLSNKYRRPVNFGGKNCFFLTFEEVVGVEE